MNISPFIANLPFGKNTTNFGTPDASGSTSQARGLAFKLCACTPHASHGHGAQHESCCTVAQHNSLCSCASHEPLPHHCLCRASHVAQAANIQEALEAGARTLLVDEDTSATNFMIRDARMQVGHVHAACNVAALHAPAVCAADSAHAACSSRHTYAGFYCF